MAVIGFSRHVGQQLPFVPSALRYPERPPMPDKNAATSPTLPVVRNLMHHLPAVHSRDGPFPPGYVSCGLGWIGLPVPIGAKSVPSVVSLHNRLAPLSCDLEGHLHCCTLTVNFTVGLEDILLYARRNYRCSVLVVSTSS